MAAPVPYVISLAVQRTEHDVPARTQAFRLRIVATAVSGFQDAGVFICQQVAGAVAQFTNIASPANLTEYALDVPDQQTGFFRSAICDIILYNMPDLDEALLQIEAQLKVLCQEMLKLQVDLGPSVIVVISSEP